MKDTNHNGSLSRLRGSFKRMRNLGLIALIAVLWVVLSILSPFFLRTSNIMVLLRQTATTMVCGVGMTFVIIAGGTDLSVGSVAALSGMVTGIAVNNWGLSFFPAFLCGIAVGILFGTFNGILISYFKLQPMVCTLGSMSMARGITLISTSGRSLFVLNPTMNKIGNAGLWQIPWPVVIAFAVFLIGWIILSFTRFGRNVYAIGGNEEAARLSGVKTNLNKTIIYMISGVCAALVGILYVCTLGASEPTVGQGLELDAIAVTAIGGTSLLGGMGSVVGTIFGAILIGTIKNGLTILNIVSYYQQLIIGAVIIIAVLLEQVKKHKNK